MTDDEAGVDQFLAAAMSGVADWPSEWTGSRQQEAVSRRALYHGIAALLTERARELGSWPEAPLQRLRQQAIAQAMWELRHQAVLTELLERLADGGIGALFLKGSALAYDLYPVPAHRSRGDSDLLIAPADLASARRVLQNLGYVWHPEDEGMSDEFALQEEWVLSSRDGTRHAIDLHWQLLNAPSLAGVLPADACWSDTISLPRLSRSARAMNHVQTLVHTCVHRAMHITSPYIVDGQTYYGADRLIWSVDIDLLARSLSSQQWSVLEEITHAQGIAPVLLSGLEFARRVFDTPIPKTVDSRLRAAPRRNESAYLLRSSQLRRAWSDLAAIRGWRGKAAFLAARTWRSAVFVRRKYPEMKHWPLPLLHARRVTELLHRRGSHTPQR